MEVNDAMEGKKWVEGEASFIYASGLMIKTTPFMIYVWSKMWAGE